MDLPDDFDPETHEIHGYFAVNFLLADDPYRPGVKELYYALARAINVTSASAAIAGEQMEISPDIQREMQHAMDECWERMLETDAPLEHMLGAVGSITDNIAMTARQMPQATVDIFNATMTSAMYVVKDLSQRWLHEHGIKATVDEEPEPGPLREYTVDEFLSEFGPEDDSDSES